MKIKSVCLFGCGKTAAEFYKRNHDKIEIAYAVSNNAKEKTFAPEEHIIYEVRRPVHKEDGFREKIIICSQDYENIAEQLTVLGYVPFQDFMDYELAEALIEEKKIVLLYGFCHLRGIKDYLNIALGFQMSHKAFFFDNYQKTGMYQQMKLQFLVSNCDVFLYGMAVSQENHRKNEMFKTILNKNVVSFCLPALYFGGYFPQKTKNVNEMNPYAIKCENYDYTPFSFGDVWLNQCIDQQMDIDAIMEGFRKNDLYSADDVKRNLEKDWQRIKFQEKQTDFFIKDFLEKNYRRKRLFRNEAHMENCILKQYTKQILERLGMSEVLPDLEEPLMKCSQHLIYPCVGAALNLEWNVETEELDLYTYQGWKKVSVIEYIKTYVLSCGEIKKLKGMALLP